VLCSFSSFYFESSCLTFSGFKFWIRICFCWDLRPEIIFTFVFSIFESFFSISLFAFPFIGGSVQ